MTKLFHLFGINIFVGNPNTYVYTKQIQYVSSFDAGNCVRNSSIKCKVVTNRVHKSSVLKYVHINRSDVIGRDTHLDHSYV